MDAEESKPPSRSRFDRRTLLVRGAVLGAAVVLPGCSSGSPSTSSSTSAKTGTAGKTKPPSLSDLKDAVKGKVITPRSGDYRSAAEVYNLRYDGASPVAVVQAESAADVQAAVKWAGQADVAVVPRSGGHSYAGYSTGDGVLVVDLKKMSKVEFDRGSGVATIGPGAQLIDVYKALAAKGVTVPAGSCPSVGLGGLAPGGGMGLAGRKFGLTCDNIESVEVVTADGEVRHANSKSEPDLYWGFCGGGGGNFGVATSFQMTTHPVSSAAYFSISWPWERASDALAAWQELVPEAPDGLTSIFHLSTGSSSPSVSANGQFFGSTNDLTKLLAPLSAVDGGNLSTGTDSYMNLMLRWAGCLGESVDACHTVGTSPGGTMPRERFVAKSDYATKPIPAPGRQRLIDAVDKAPGAPEAGSLAILLDSYGGEINRVKPDATAFVHRDALFAMQYLAYPAESAGLSASQSRVDSAWSSMQNFVSGMAYQDYIDPRLEGWEKAYYGDNYARLQQIKSSYDPDFRFRFKQAIRPA